jgi:hypothetical protein
VGGKSANAEVLPRFFKKECAISSAETLGLWPPLWWSCLPKVCRGGPEYCALFLPKDVFFLQKSSLVFYSSI